MKKTQVGLAPPTASQMTLTYTTRSLDIDAAADDGALCHHTLTATDFTSFPRPRTITTTTTIYITTTISFSASLFPDTRCFFCLFFFNSYCLAAYFRSIFFGPDSFSFSRIFFFGRRTQVGRFF